MWSHNRVSNWWHIPDKKKEHYVNFTLCFCVFIRGVGQHRAIKNILVKSCNFSHIFEVKLHPWLRKPKPADVYICRLTKEVCSINRFLQPYCHFWWMFLHGIRIFPLFIPQCANLSIAAAHWINSLISSISSASSMSPVVSILSPVYFPQLDKCNFNGKWWE